MMSIRWLAVLCALALLAQYSLSFPEEKPLEEFELDEPEGKGYSFNIALKNSLPTFSKIIFLIK